MKQDIGQKVIYLGSLLGFLLFYPLSGNWERLLEGKNLLAAGEIALVLLFLLLGDRAGRKGLLPGRKLLLLVSAGFLLELYLHRMLLPFGFSFLYFSFVAFLFLAIFGELGRCYEKIKHGIAGGQGKAPEYRLLFALPFLLIQLNRMNIAADYDSLRYGLRSQYVLFNGNFFSSLGQINAVYSYPKGLELLLTPLSTFHSFALNFMFQFWTLIGISILVYLLAEKLSGSRERAVDSVNVLLMITAVTNMSITSKTDLLTLLLQLLLLRYFLKEERGKAIAAGILTYSLKPTAVVFTTLSLGVLLLISVWQDCSEGRGVKKLGRELKAAWLPLLFSTGYTGLMTLRTLLITGIPISTTFTALFQRMGFQVKWPFNLDAHVDYAGEIGLFEGALAVLRRIVLLLFCPVGEDMAHVAIAWGGVTIPILLYFAGRSLALDLPFLFKKKSRTEEDGRDSHEEELWAYSRRLLYGNLLIVTVFSVWSLGMLWQVDGNYYILFYTLLLLAAFSRQKENGESFPGSLYLCALLTTLITSWAGAVGFTPIDLLNKGYYDNLQEIRQEEVEKGTYRLWEIMARDKKNRVLSFSETPDAYKVPCNVQSITDVEGSGGSPGVYDERKLFEWFLGFAGSDYVYLEREFLKKPESVRNLEILPALIEDGMLKEPEIEGGYLLFTVDQERLRYVWEELSPPEISKEETGEVLRIYESWLWG